MITNTNTNEKGAGAINTNDLHTDTYSAKFRGHGAVNQFPDGNTITANLKVVCLRIKRFASGFYIDRSIGADSILLLIVAAFMLIQGAIQWMH